MSDYRVFDSLQDVVLVINGEGSVLYGNQAASTLLGVSVKRLSSAKLVSQFMELESDVLEAESIRQISDSTQMTEVAFKISSGDRGWVQVTVQPQPSFFSIESEARWIVYMRDVSLEKTLHEKYKIELDQKESVITDLQTAQAKLEDYSKNLEAMVESRTAELNKTNSLLKTILDSLGQGILVFNENGDCLPVFSKICQKFFGQTPTGLQIENLLQLQAGDLQAFHQWRKAVFSEMLEFEDLVPLAPSNLKNLSDVSRGIERHISLGYNAMRSESGQIQGVVMVATDRTSEVQALKEAAHERETVRRIVRVGRNRDSFLHFVRDAKMLLVQFKSWRLQRSSLHAQREEVLRHLHTLKGGAASFAFAEIAKQSHDLESKLKDLPIEDWDQVEEILQSEAQTMRAILEADMQGLVELLGPMDETRLEMVEIPMRVLKRWTGDFSRAKNLPQLQKHLRDFVAECLEKPIEPFVRGFEAGLRDLAIDLGKKFDSLEVIGGDIKVVEEPLRPLFTNLVHAFRNSIDHGFETTEDRERLGKTAAGHISIKFSLEKELRSMSTGVRQRNIQNLAHERRGGHYLKIEVADDGRGINLTKLRAKLIQLGLEKEAMANDDEVSQMIFRPELSTSESVTEVSGRGIGMNAIFAEVQQVHGQISVASLPGVGMTLTIVVPLAVHPVLAALAA